MGRGSDEWFGTRWTSRPGEWADRLRSLPKYVVSATLKDPKWTNATVLNGDVVEEVSKLKQRIAGEMVVYASAPLVRTLTEKDLVDELRLTVYPVVLGGGMRLFGDTTSPKPMRLVRAETLGENLTYLVYQFVRAAQTPMTAPLATPALAPEQVA
jgi:dihydrofolate reductase